MEQKKNNNKGKAKKSKTHRFLHNERSNNGLFNHIGTEFKRIRAEYAYGCSPR